MATYIGFSTQNSCKPKTTNALIGSAGGPGGIRQEINLGNKFTVTDSQLVVQDFVNALNIRQGTKVGQPGYGSRVWEFIFEPNTAANQFKLESELKRVASRDTRIELSQVKSYPFENGILVEIQAIILPFNDVVVAKINFNSATEIATLV